MVEVVRSATFDRWLNKLKDRRAAARVVIRINRLAVGNAGDVNLSATVSPNYESTMGRASGSNTSARRTG